MSDPTTGREPGVHRLAPGMGVQDHESAGGNRLSTGDGGAHQPAWSSGLGADRCDKAQLVCHTFLQAGEIGQTMLSIKIVDICKGTLFVATLALVLAGCTTTASSGNTTTTSVGDVFSVQVTKGSGGDPDLLAQTFGGTLVTRKATISSGEEALAQEVLSENADEQVMSWQNVTLGEIRMRPYSPERRTDGTVCRPYGIRYAGVGQFMGWTTVGGTACKDQAGVWRKAS